MRVLPWQLTPGISDTQPIHQPLSCLMTAVKWCFMFRKSGCFTVHENAAEINPKIWKTRGATKERKVHEGAKVPVLVKRGASCHSAAMQNQSKEAGTAPLLEWVLRLFPDTPKSRAKEWIVAGRVSVHGSVIRKPHQVMQDPKEGLQLGNRHATTLDCGSGWPIHPRVTLLHLDPDLAVVNKGPGVISVPAGDGEISALSILADFIAGKLKLRGKMLPPPYRRLEPLPVHRLDQYTSGVFCMATNPSARHDLIEQLRVRSMKREYVAFVEGRLDRPKGTWRNWLQLSRDELRQNIISDAQAKAAGDDAREAITHYEVITEYPFAEGKGCVTKLRLRLESGRKHQIRAQAAHAGHPLLGDRTYNPGYRGHEATGAPIDFPRQALHAEVLELDHPGKNGQRMKWVAALPKDLRQLEATLRTPNSTRH